MLSKLKPYNLYGMLGLSLSVSAAAYGQDSYGPQLSAIGETSAECYYNDAGEFVLEGGFDTEARLCFSRTYKAGTAVIRINSNGGQNAVGLGLSHRLKDEDFHLIIERACNSACAQYIIPLAREVTVEDGAGIVIHGVLSDYFLTQNYKDSFMSDVLSEGVTLAEAKKEYKIFKKYTKRQIKAAEVFRQDNNIRRGWFMQADTWTESDIDNPVYQIDVEWLRQNNTNGLLIDRKFLESCLPDVKVNYFIGPSDPRSNNFEGYKARIEAANLLVLPDAQCID